MRELFFGIIIFVLIMALWQEKTWNELMKKGGFYAKRKTDKNIDKTSGEK